MQTNMIYSDVEITCNFNEHNEDDKEVIWFRQRPGSQPVEIWKFQWKDDLPTEVSIAELGGRVMIDGNEGSNYNLSHKITVVRVTRQDEADYWCDVRIHGRNHIAAKKTLYVQGGSDFIMCIVWKFFSLHFALRPLMFVG